MSATRLRKKTAIRFGRAMRTLLEYLIGLGHRRIAFVGGRSNVKSTLEKRQAYTDVLREHAIRDILISEGNYGQEDGYLAVKKLCSHRKINSPLCR